MSYVALSVCVTTAGFLYAGTQAMRLASCVLFLTVSSVSDMWWCVWRVEVNRSRYVRCSCTAWQVLHASTWGLAWRTLPGAEGHICYQHCYNTNGRNAHLVGLVRGEACNGKDKVDAMVEHNVQACGLQHNLLENIVMHQLCTSCAAKALPAQLPKKHSKR